MSTSNDSFVPPCETTLTSPPDNNAGSPKEDTAIPLVEDMNKLAISVASPDNTNCDTTLPQESPVTDAKKWTTTLVTLEADKVNMEHAGVEDVLEDVYCSADYLAPNTVIAAVDWIYCRRSDPNWLEISLQMLVELIQQLRKRHPTWKPIHGSIYCKNDWFRLYREGMPGEGGVPADGKIYLLQYQYEGRTSFYEHKEKNIYEQWQCLIPTNECTQEDVAPRDDNDGVSECERGPVTAELDSVDEEEEKDEEAKVE
ncbi:hypothetical protein ASPCADRAFT_403047 [Aspergillus carbonarius ITEM 5010]|uniref:Uncharacterized protein n=1 Tax=Aspergillus carbonarius (strain ITEM 5010) TaxID=602072 RepID=A0A1R3RW54_ASPC5|nr:hypothetical protein ASPCADRAFT_403047 [Aspergillus carbonarius ITEM 5010]